MKKRQRMTRGIVFFAAACLLAGAVGYGAEGTEGAKAGVRAQDDFYAYVNGESLEKATLKYGNVVGGPISEMNDLIQEEIFQVVKEVGESKEVYPEGSAEAIVRAAYLQYLEYLKAKGAGKAANESAGKVVNEGAGKAANESAGKAVNESTGKAANATAGATAVFDEAAERIQGAGNLEDLLAVAKELAGEMGFLPFFRMELNNDYQRDGEYALFLEQKQTIGGHEVKEIYESDDMRKYLLGMATDALVSLGETPKVAKEKAKAYVYLILDVVFATDYSLEEEMDFDARYQFIGEEKMGEILGGLSIQTVEDIYGMLRDNPYGGYYVQDASQLRAIGKCFREENVDALKTWMICELFVSYKEFLAEKYHFVKLYLGSDFDEPERIAARYVDGMLPEQVSRLYEKAYYTSAMDVFLDRAYEDVKGSYRELINGATWLSRETRAGLLDKLERMRFIKPGMGSVSEIRVDEAIGTSPLQTACNLNRIRHEEFLTLIGKPRDEGRLMMPMQVMNACYNPQNTFTVTVAIMHSPYFDPKASYETNLGGIGMVMAHEIGHAFDGNGLKFTAEGVYDPDWIGVRDREALRQSEQSMVEYFNGFAIMDVYHVDGEQTLGENFADKGGMECLMNVVKQSSGRRELFENYAKIWCLWKEDAAGIDQLLTDEHSPEYVRVNAVLASTEEFYELYGVKEGDGMYVAPERRVSRWGSY